MDPGEKNLMSGKEKDKTQEKECIEEIKEKIKTVESTCQKYLSTYWKSLYVGKGYEYSPCPPSYLQDPPSVLQDPMWNNFPPEHVLFIQCSWNHRTRSNEVKYFCLNYYVPCFHYMHVPSSFIILLNINILTFICVWHIYDLCFSKFPPRIPANC